MARGKRGCATGGGRSAANGQRRVAVVLKGYPRLSETFIAQELLALERHGVPLALWSLRHPTDDRAHPIHAAIRARDGAKASKAMRDHIDSFRQNIMKSV